MEKYRVYSHQKLGCPQILLLDSSYTDGFGGGQFFLKNLFLGLKTDYSITILTNNVYFSKYGLDEYFKGDLPVLDGSYLNSFDKIIVNDVTGLKNNKYLCWKLRQKIYPLIHMRLDSFSKVKNGLLWLKGAVYGSIIQCFFSKVFCVSRTNVQFLKNSAVYVGNGVLDEKIDNLSEYKDIDIIWIGRLSKEKNPLRFVEVCEEIIAKNQLSKVYMIGDGPLRKEVEALIRHKKLDLKISITGWLDKKDIFNYLSRTNTLMITSNHEGLPTVALEALLHKVNVISTEGSDLDYWDSNSIFISKHNVVNLVEAYNVVKNKPKQFDNYEKISFKLVLARVKQALI